MARSFLFQRANWAGLLRPLKRFSEETCYRFLPRPKLRGRYQLASLLNARGLCGTGVEIGVYEGWFSHQILTSWRGRRLISVDPWKSWGKEYNDTCNQNQETMNRIYGTARKLLQRYGNRSEIWRVTSEEAARQVPDGVLDFVYIDAQHHEAAVHQDIALWYPKVRRGGMLAGHDYFDGVLPYGVFGVKTAVDRFVSRNDLPLYVTGEADYPSWFLFKPVPAALESA